MNSRLKITKLTPQLHGRIKKSNHLTGKCRQCEKKLKINSMIITKKSSYKSGTTVNWYHEDCARRLNIID